MFSGLSYTGKKEVHRDKKRGYTTDRTHTDCRHEKWNKLSLQDDVNDVTKSVMGMINKWKKE